jgi:hypothetical protein
MLPAPPGGVMKEQQFSKTSDLAVTTLTILVSASLPLPRLSAQESIVIEGGPNKVLISDEDGEIDARSPANVLVPGNTLQRTPANDRGTAGVETVPGADVTMRVPDQAARDKPTIAAIKPGGEPALAEFNAEEEKALIKMADEIGLAVSATQAKMTFESDYLFEESSPALAEGSKDLLKQIAEYMKLSGLNEMVVAYRYDPEKETPLDARLHTAHLVTFVDSCIETVDADFTVMDPEPVSTPVVEEGQSAEALEEYESLVEVILR